MHTFRYLVLLAVLGSWPVHACAGKPIDTAAALVAAVRDGDEGAVIEIGPGTFELESPLEPKARMTLKGAGMDKTFITGAATWRPSTKTLPDPEMTMQKMHTRAYLIRLKDNAAGITISDMTLRGPHVHGAVFGWANQDLHLHHLRIKETLWSGLRTFLMKGAKIHDCEFIDAGGRWDRGAPGIRGGITGGAIFAIWMGDCEIYDNRFVRTRKGPAEEFYGIKVRQGVGCRVHHNTIEANFSMEFPFENDGDVEIDHNVCHGTISIPKYAGGVVPKSGRTFHIHHNWMKDSYPGPGLIKNVEIRGFDYGIKWTVMDYSMTLEHITLKDQNKVGLSDSTGQAHIRDLTSVNTVPVLESVNQWGGSFVMVIGGDFSGGAPGNPAIISGGALLARDLKISGYGAAIDDRSPARKSVPMGGNSTTITEYVKPGIKSLFPSPQRTLRLPIEETPEYQDEQPAQWANITDFGAVREGKTDSTAAIQKALDSGKATIWLPGKSDYLVSGSLAIPATVRHVAGPHATLVAHGGVFTDVKDPQAIFKVAADSSHPLIIEHIETRAGKDAEGAMALDHAAPRTVAWKHGSIGGGWGDGKTPCYVNSATGGKFFVEDCMGSKYRIIGPQQVWARQLNTEYGSIPMLDVSGKGARVWIMGWKTENSPKQQVLRVANGAEVESFGPFNYMLNSSSDTPLITNDEGRLSMCFRQAGQHGYGLAIRETRDGVTREAKNLWGDVALYLGYKESDRGSVPSPDSKQRPGLTQPEGAERK
jgi:hypothetical protein